MPTSAKEIVLRVVTSRVARDVVRRYHYSGRCVANTQINLGVYLRGRLRGAIQLGPSMFREQMRPLVRDTPANGLLEIHRIAFADDLPRNSESRALAIVMRMLRRHRPEVQWVLTFADGCQCGDGTIYRAAGFVLTQIKKNTGMAVFPDGRVMHRMGAWSGRAKDFFQTTGGSSGGWAAYVKAKGGTILDGAMMRYIYFLHPTARERLMCPALPYSDIAKAGRRMYRGHRVGSDTSDTAGVQPAEGGAAPTPTLIS